MWFLGAVFSPSLMLARVRENGGDYKSQALTCFDLAGGMGIVWGLVPSSRSNLELVQTPNDKRQNLMGKCACMLKKQSILA